MIGGVIDRFQRLSGFPTTDDLIGGLMMKFEEPLLVDGPAEIAFLFNRLKMLIAAAVAILVALASDIWQLNILAVVLAVVVAFALLAAALRDHYTRYIITTDRILRIEGVFARQQNSIPYSKVTDLTFRQSAGDRLLNVARIRIDSANEASPFRELTDLTNPRLFMKTLSTMVNIRQTPNRVGGRQPTDREPKKVVILRALLDEIRAANLAVIDDDERILDAVFDDWVSGSDSPIVDEAQSIGALDDWEFDDEEFENAD